MMNAKQVKVARQLMGLNQTDFAALLGWTSKRNIVNLERDEKSATVQTSLAIECLLRRENKMENFDIISDVTALIEQQERKLIKSNLELEDVQEIVFGEDDVVEAYLREKQINEDDIDLESLRNLQHDLVNSFR